MVSEFVNRTIDDNITFQEFIEENIKLLLRSGRSFIICSRTDIPPVLLKKDEDGIWVTFINEL